MTEHPLESHPLESHPLESLPPSDAERGAQPTRGDVIRSSPSLRSALTPEPGASIVLPRRPPRVGQLIGRDFLRAFIANPVRENAIRARGGGASGVMVVSLGLVAFGVAALGVLLAARLAALPIGPGSATLGSATAPGRPVGIPVFAYPALMCLLLFAVAIGIFGATFAKRTLATLAVVMLLVPTVLLAGTAWQFRSSAWSGYLALPTVALIAPAVVAMRRRQASADLVIVVAAILASLAVGATAITQIIAYTAAGTSGGLPLFGAGLEQVVTMLGVLVAPMAILAGGGAVSFARTATGFVGRSIERTARGRSAPLVVIATLLLVLAVAMTVMDVAGARSPGRWLVRLAVTAAVMVLGIAWWRWAARGVPATADAVESGASTGAPTVAIALAAFTAPLTLGLVAASVLSAVGGGTGLVGPVTRLADAMGHAWTGTTYALLVGALFLAAAAYVARSRPSLAAAWLGLAGLVLIALVGWNQLFPGPEWGGFTITDIARAGSVLLLAGAVWLLVRLRSLPLLLAAFDVREAFAISGVLVLILQGSFAADPFGALFGFAGIGLVFFGVVWGFLTSGAHSSVTGLPGLGRTAVLLSYAVLSTTLLAWGLATGPDAHATMSGAFGQVGSNLLGSTVLLALIAAWLPGQSTPIHSRAA